MKPRYIIINEEKRTWFEKEWQLPHGYAHHYITFSLENAIDQLKNYSSYTRDRLSIERVDDFGREIVYKGGLADEWTELPS